MRTIAASFFLLIGTLLAAAGIPLVLWLLLAVYEPERASAWVLWALERAQVSTGTATQLAADLVRRNALIAEGVAAAMLCISAFAALGSARQALRPGDMSHDGKGRIELRTPRLRVGRPVEGTIWLTRDVEPGEPVRVELSCKRVHGSADSETVEVAYWDLIEVPVVETPLGASVPFRFNVPPIAPASGGAGLFGRSGYRWRLAFARKRSPITFASVFPLELGPAPDEEFRVFERQQPPGAGRQTPAVRSHPAADTDPAAVTRPSPLVTDSIIADDARREPVLRHLDELPGAPPAAPPLAPEIPALSGVMKWALILLGVPIGVITVAYATVLVLGLALR